MTPLGSGVLVYILRLPVGQAPVQHQRTRDKPSRPWPSKGIFLFPTALLCSLRQLPVVLIGLESVLNSVTAWQIASKPFDSLTNARPSVCETPKFGM
jgi:hypothetical protein